MALYTDLNREQFEEILSSYDIGSLWNFRHLHGGVANSVYYFTTLGGEFILTICNHKSPRDVRLRTVLLDNLFRAGLCVPELIATKERKPFVYFNDQPIIVKRFIEGYPGTDAGEKILFDLGRKLAQIHTTTLSFELPYRMPYDSKQFLSVRRNNEYFGRWIIDKTRYLDEHIPKDAPIGLIHGDLFPDNFLVYDDEVIAIIDFEESCQFFYAFDIANALIGNCFEDKTFNKDKTKAFIDGYQSVRKLTPAEVNNFNFFISYAACSLAYWRFKQFNVNHPDQDRKDSYKEMMEIADFYETAFTNSFFESFFKG